MKRILTILLTALSSLTAFSQIQPAPPTGSKAYGTTTFIAPDGMLWYGTNPLKYRGVYPKTKVDSLLALIAPFDASLYYTKVASDARFYPLSTNPAGYLTSFTEVDPTVPAYAKSLTAFSVIKTSTDALYPTQTGGNASGTWNINVLGNAETVTNGVYSTGSYANPSWITSLAYSKLTGTPDLTGYELLANKQNSLSLDGTGIKYPTVDAVVAALATGQSIGANTTGNAATATNSTQWNGQSFEAVGIGTIADYIIGRGSDGVWRPASTSETRIWLGIPSGGETLQSVTDRGSTTDNTISSYSTSNDAQIYISAESGSYGEVQAVNAANTGTKNLVLQNVGGNVGIGTTTPDNYTGRSAVSINGTNGGILTLQVGGTKVSEMYAAAGGITQFTTTGSFGFSGGPTTFSGGLTVGTGTYSAGSGQLFNTSVSGTVLGLTSGSSTDFGMIGPAGNFIMSVPTGTSNTTFSGNITAPSAQIANAPVNPTDVVRLTDLSGYELLSNKSTSTSLGTSNTLYPTQNAVKTYVDGLASNYVNTTGNQTGILGTKSWNGNQTHIAGTNSLWGSFASDFTSIQTGQIQMSNPGLGTSIVMSASWLQFQSGAGINGQIIGPISGSGLEWTLPSSSGTVMVLDTTSSPPSTSSSTGKTGTVIISGGYKYVCVSNNTWIRSAVETSW